MKKLVLCLLALTTASTLASAPQTVSYQGRLTDTAGNPVADGNHVVTFSLFTTETGGSALWSEIQTVSTSNGLLATVLGLSNPIPNTALLDTALYLEILIDPGPPLAPRSRLSSVPFSMSSSILHVVKTDASSGESGELFIGSEPTSGAAPEMKWDVVANKPASGSSSATQTFVSADSGVIETTTASSSSGQATGKRLHKPLTITKEMNVSGAGSINNVMTSLDADSGYIESFQVETTTAKLTGKRQHKPIKVTKEWGAASLVDSTRWHTVLHADSGFVDSVRMNKADIISEVSHGTNQTKEHVLLARQVGVPGATNNTSALLQTDNTSSAVDLHYTDGSDSSEVHTSANESAAISSLRTLVSTQTRSATALEYGLIGLAGPDQSSTSHYEYDAAGRTISQTTKVSLGKFDAIATQVDPAGSGPGVFDSSMILTMMDSVRMLHALFVNGDTAATTDASTDKRKQSLYFPETMLEAIEMLVETNQAAIRLFEINPASGMQDSNVVIESNGNLTMQGKLTVGDASGLSATGQAMTVPRLTTSQRDAMTPVNGMIIYNTTTNQFNFYENFAWVTK